MRKNAYKKIISVSVGAALALVVPVGARYFTQVAVFQQMSPQYAAPQSSKIIAIKECKQPEACTGICERIAKAAADYKFTYDACIYVNCQEDGYFPGEGMIYQWCLDDQKREVEQAAEQARLDEQLRLQQEEARKQEELLRQQQEHREQQRLLQEKQKHFLQKSL